MMNKAKIESLLKENNISLSKRLGQNFLVSEIILDKIIKSSHLKKSDIVLEIGAGLGVLTKRLAQESRKVIAIEKDKRLALILKQELREYKNIEIIEKDIFKINIKELTARYPIFKVISNLPYCISSLFIRTFLEIDNPPKEMVLMLQKEVAERICAKPGKMSLLSLSAQFYSIPEIICYVSKECFWPQPKVDSAVITLIVKHKKNKIDKNLFFKIAKAGFSHPRKQLAKNLSNILELDKRVTKLWLLENRIMPEQRSETLTIEDWQNLTNTFKKFQKMI